MEIAMNNIIYILEIILIILFIFLKKIFHCLIIKLFNDGYLISK